MVFFTDRVKALFFLLSSVPAFLVIFLAAIFVLAAPFFTLLFAWRALAPAVLLVLVTVFLTLFFAWRALASAALLVLASAALFFLYLYNFGQWFNSGFTFCMSNKLS